MSGFYFYESLPGTYKYVFRSNLLQTWTLTQTIQAPTSFPGYFLPGYLGNTLVWAGHVPRSKFSARGGVGKVSNYIIPVEIFCLTVKNINFANY